MRPGHQATGTVLTEIERPLVGRKGPVHGNLVVRNRLHQRPSAFLRLSLVRGLDSARFKAILNRWAPRWELARDLLPCLPNPSLRPRPANNHPISPSFKLSRLGFLAPICLRARHR